MRAPIVVAILSLSAAVAADPAHPIKHKVPTVQPVKIVRSPDEVAASLEHLLAADDAAALARALDVPFEYKGLDAGADCETRFGRDGTVKKKADLPAFAGCLAAALGNRELIGVSAYDGSVDYASGVHVVVSGGRAIQIVIGDDEGAEGEPGGVEGGVVGGVDTGPPPPPPPPPPLVAPQIVAPSVLAASRISGQSAIAPDAKTRAAIVRSGKSRVLASAKLCLDRAGAVTGVSIMKSSGFPAYDDEIRAAMRTWKYKPFTVNGVATAVCTAIMFVYTP